MVTLYRVDAGGQRGARLFVPQWPDAHGRFAFNAPPGTYDVVATPARWYFSVGEDSERVTVPPGNTAMTLLLPKVPLARGSSPVVPALPSAPAGLLQI